MPIPAAPPVRYRADPVAPHAYMVPLVRELPQRVGTCDRRTW
jgi:hypothetical protein